MKPYSKTLALCLMLLLLNLTFVSCEKETFGIDGQENSLVDQEKEFVDININGATVTTEKIGKEYFLGDIRIPASAVTEATDKNGVTTKATGITQGFWPNNTVHYVLDESIAGSRERAIRSAIHHWELFTDIKFVETTNWNGSVLFYAGNDCSATLGYHGDVEHNISVGNSCGVVQIIHEIGHLVGFWHEQNRKDRDQYVQVHYENIPPSIFFQFETYVENDNDGTEYSDFDFDSVMLYDSFNFSTNGQPTMTKLDGSTFPDGEILSVKDLQGVNAIYTEGSPKTIAMMGSNNRYVSSENGKKAITSNRTAIGSWERFTVVPIGGGFIALQGNNERYLTANLNTGVLEFTSQTIGEAQHMEFELAGSSSGGEFFYGIKPRGGQNLGFSDFSTGALLANTTLSGDSVFSVVILED